ncbi:c5c933eb-030e-4943-85d5-016d585f436d [Sclerotinia trifoliorum]|uniref:C5c933eb-030e-4943-85d5-016d585f436d n=1 Tax=Sclerotinia trifoliorum TaxID=28548 RepID=A0A8H2VX50_9HELO|nr:c5c933eb-030e-4943-85d5-016d585f436d [Sclerotinia trifoliorum]
MSAPMINWVPIVNRIYKYVANTTIGSSTQSITLPSVEIHDIETAPEKRPRTLKHLLKSNHINHSILYNHNRFHNHLPHHLGSAYLLGADYDQLQRVYAEESKVLEEWQDSPGEITDADWRDFLGEKVYQRAYVDFFEDELALKFSYDWKALVEEYLYSGKAPLVNGLTSGLGHPLIHLGYAVELNSRELAIEALSLTSTCYNFMHKYLDDPSYTKASTCSTTSPLEILHKIHADSRLDGFLDEPSPSNITKLFEKHEDFILEHWNAWSITDPEKQFRDSQEAAVNLLVQTVKPGTHAYDFFVVHILTTSHAVRILLPFVPAKFQVGLIRQWWLFTIAVYCAQMRPKISEDIEQKPGQGWKYVEDKAINGVWSTDPHYVKAIRAIREAAFTWGDVHERYLSMAATFADDFNGWTGFGSSESDSIGGHH